MNDKQIRELKENWFRINEPSGKRFGYPDCCIRAFGDNPPELMTGIPPKEMIDRYKAGHINEKFTGFIPCINHARQILSGQITLASLIKNRDKKLPPFPHTFPVK